MDQERTSFRKHKYVIADLVIIFNFTLEKTLFFCFFGFCSTARVFLVRAAGPLEAPCSMSSESRTFTVWMKSLVYHANGCTVFDSKGEIVYRVDNYDSKCSREVFLMDRQGKVLCTIQRKRLRIFGRWDGYRLDTEKPWFQVRKCSRVLMGDLACKVTVGHRKYWIVNLAHKASFRIVDTDGDVVAEVKQKQACSGIMLGDDVFSLEVKPHFDHSLIMALVTVNGLINGKM